MAEKINIILLQIIIDWGCLDGNVWSHQVVWSGSFADCNRVLQLLHKDSNTTNSIQLRVEHFDLDLNFRDRFIALYRNYPLVVSMTIVSSSKTITIEDDDEGDTLICAICHETLSTEWETKQLPCSHLFHGSHIFSWFHYELSILECPLCNSGFRVLVSKFIAPLSPYSMKIISSNIRTINILGKQRHFRDRLIKEKHSITLMQEIFYKKIIIL